MKLYIVRHGETQWNKMHILQGQLDSPLTEKGIGGAEKIKEALEKIEFKSVYTSQQKRAIDTAEIILAEKDKNYIIDNNIAEMAYGDWQGKSKEEICSNEEYKDMYFNYFQKPEDYVPVAGGEKFEDVLKRAEEFLDRVKREHSDDEAALAVTHGVFIKAIFNLIKKRNIKEFWDRPFITNCSISVLEIDDDIRILKEADTGHLGEHAVATEEVDYIK